MTDSSDNSNYPEIGGIKTNRSDDREFIKDLKEMIAECTERGQLNENWFIPRIEKLCYMMMVTHTDSVLDKLEKELPEKKKITHQIPPGSTMLAQEFGVVFDRGFNEAVNQVKQLIQNLRKEL